MKHYWMVSHLFELHRIMFM